jgi:hypothetical protein
VEGPEESRGARHDGARAVDADAGDRLTLFERRANLYGNAGFPSREPPGVRDEVYEERAGAAAAEAVRL